MFAHNRPGIGSESKASYSMTRQGQHRTETESDGYDCPSTARCYMPPREPDGNLASLYLRRPSSCMDVSSRDCMERKWWDEWGKKAERGKDGGSDNLRIQKNYLSAGGAVSACPGPLPG